MGDLVDFDGSSLKLLEVELQGSDYRNVCFTGSGYILGEGNEKIEIFIWLCERFDKYIQF